MIDSPAKLYTFEQAVIKCAKGVDNLSVHRDRTYKVTYDQGIDVKKLGENEDYLEYVTKRIKNIKHMGNLKLFLGEDIFWSAQPLTSLDNLLNKLTRASISE